MYELGSPVSDIANLTFGLVGIWMAHSLYKTTRQRWQAVLSWVLVLFFCAFGATALSMLLPAVPYVRLSMLVGFSGIFAYLYLFTDIPIQQRVFTYFMVDTSQTLLVLFTRTTAQFIEGRVPLSMNALFLCVYVPVAVGFLLLFRFYLRGYILKALPAFQSHLTTLAFFAAAGYLTLLLMDPWGPWPALDAWDALGWYAVIGFVALGYALAFRTLTSILEQETAQTAAARLGDQLALSERYYDTLVGRIEQSRIRDHDLRHHVNALSGLCRAGQWDELRRYVAGMGAELPEELHRQYCENGTVNALLCYYAGLCKEEGIPFRCKVRLTNLGRVQPIHLCVIFGNALQNALEAARQLPQREKAFLDVRAVEEERRLAIAISNSFSGGISWNEAGVPVTSKAEPGHGLGLASIRETARRYGGWCGCQAEGGVFTLSVTFHLDTP